MRPVRLFELVYFLRSQFDLDGFKQLLQMMRLGGTYDGCGHSGSSQDPRAGNASAQRRLGN